MRIGEVARRTGLTVRTLRHYDDLGLLTPQERTSGDYRLYGTDDLERLLSIQNLKSLGLSLEEIRAALDDPAFSVDEVLDRHMTLVAERLEAERDLLARLRALRSRPRSDWEAVIDTIALTERLRHPDPAVRFRAALTAPTLAPLDTLLDGLSAEQEPGVREVLTWSVAQHGSEAVGPVAARLEDADPAVRRQMVHVLSKLHDPRAVGPVARLLDDADPGVRAKAAFALGQLGGDEAVVRLVGALGDDDSVVRDAVTAALARIGRDAVDSIAVVARTGTAPRARLQAVEVLGAVGVDSATAVLIDALSDDDADVRFEALWGLGSLVNDEAGRAIRKARTSPDRRTRLLAERLSASRQQG